MAATYLHEPPYKKEYKHYQVLDGENLIGDFYYLSEHRSWECFFSYGEKQVRLKRQRRFLRSTRVWFVDEKSGEEIGRFRFPQLIMGEDCFTFTSTPHTGYSIFKKSSWFRHKFSLASREEEIMYDLKLIPTRFFQFDTYMEMEGSIEFNGSNLMALFAGFYLLEEQLDRDRG